MEAQEAARVYGRDASRFVVPQFDVLADRWDAHIAPDCTHFCYSLFLWEPVWWALRLVVRATAEWGRHAV